MEISKLVEAKGYKNSTVKICEFLGFSDTDQLKRAKFFAIQETYSPIPVLGISINNGDPTWRLCEVNNDVDTLLMKDIRFVSKFATSTEAISIIKVTFFLC